METTVGILADTHDNRNAVRRAVQIFNKHNACCVVHAGDIVSPFTAMDFSKLRCPMEMVYGNNDGEKVILNREFSKLGTLAPGPRIFSINSRSFLLMHEDGCLDACRSAGNVDIIIYGHTHRVDIRQETPLIINPGEAGGWLTGRSTAALLDTDSLKVEIVDLAP